MSKHIAVIQGHPDPSGNHFGNALSNAYVEGAVEAGYEVSVIDVAKLDFPLLRTKEDFEQGDPPDSIRMAQKTIGHADHLVIFYPLWLGAMPAILKGFFEQVFRPRFMTGEAEIGTKWKRLLKGKSARVVITAGDAGAHLPLVLQRTQPEEPGAQYSRFLRHRPDQASPDRVGRRGRRGGA